MAEESGFLGKHALITGSTSGIGWGLAQALAARGANVTINGIADTGTVDRLLSELKVQYRVEAWYSSADMSKPTQVKQMIVEAEGRSGGLSFLVNNAGIQHVSPVEEFPEEKWDAILAINLSSVFHACKEAIPGMKKRGFGRIVNIASVHGLVASPFKSAYVAAKHGVIGLTKTLALELADSPLTCNAICPGYVRTPLVDGQIAQQAAAHGMPEEKVIRDVILAAQPKKEFIAVTDLADFMMFLLGPAGRVVTGSSFALDGGWTAR